jgi:aryl sulfotransferase
VAARPERTRVYQNHHLDSTRWDRVALRPDDVVISTSYKAGTTWMQTIVANLLFQDGDLPGGVTEISPWIDNRFRPLDAILARIEAQTHRRFLKSHLPLDGLCWRPELRYIVVGRDARDVFMSLWNHYRSHTPAFFALVNGLPGRVGDPFPEPPGEIRELWRSWITRGWFAWETDGWPYWSHLHHARTWWEWRGLPNVRLVHFHDLLRDLEGEMRRVAAFLGIEVPAAVWPRLVHAARFETMKENADRILPGADLIWEGGARRFLYQGTNGRWRDVLGPEDLALYRAAVARTLPPDCAVWLERGREALG